MRARINREWMLAGVTMIDPNCTYIEPDVAIGVDTLIWPNTYLQGLTVIGEGCEIGPNAIIRSCRVGDRCRILASDMDQAVLEDNVDVGPFARLRKGAHLAQGVHMGNFGEVKDAFLGPGTKMGHFSYIGRCNHRLESKHWRRYGHLQLRWGAKARHRDRFGSVYRQRYHAGRPAEIRKRLAHWCRIGSDEGCSGGHSGRRHASPGDKEIE